MDEPDTTRGVEKSADTVTIPATIGDTDKLSPKFMVDAVPMRLLSSLIITPDPDAVIPVRPDPSPMKFVAVMTPVILIPPVPSIVLLEQHQP